VRVEDTSREGLMVMPVPFAEQTGSVGAEDEEQARSAR
jgi:hypothetical protein